MVEELKYLGKKGVEFRGLDAIPVREDGDMSPAPHNLEITLHCTEFTCRCPITAQPDWAEIEISYLPYCYFLESKSVKLYLEQWRDVGIFHEHLCQKILRDVVEAVRPLKASVTVKFNTRGGIAIEATAAYTVDGSQS